MSDSDSGYKSQANSTTQASSLSRIADEIKIDILSATQDVDNEAEMKKVSRNFLCEFHSPFSTSLDMSNLT